MYDLIMELSKDLSSVKASVENLEKEQRMTTALLKAILYKENPTYVVPTDYYNYVGKSFTIAGESFASAADFVEKVAKRSGKQLCKSDGFVSQGEFSALLTNLKDGDYLLINNEDIVGHGKLQQSIISAYNNASLEVVIGKGPSARRISIDVPNVNIVIYTDMPQLVSTEILSVFPLINGSV